MTVVCNVGLILVKGVHIVLPIHHFKLDSYKLPGMEARQPTPRAVEETWEVQLEARWCQNL